MFEALNDILSLFTYSFWGALVVGAVCPLIGVFFVVRRVVFLGIAVPQFAAAGVAFGFMILPRWDALLGLPVSGPGEAEGAFGFHLFWAMAFTLAALLILAWFARRDGATTEGRIAAGYAFAAAVTILFLSSSALGATHVQALLRGEILTLGMGDFLAIVTLFSLVLISFALFHRKFLIIGFDREAALSLGYRPLAWDLLLYSLVGASISLGVLTVGPLVIFGIMVIPPLAARMVAFNMLSFYLFSSLIGLVTASGGFVASYLLDWPLGPTDVVLAFGIMMLLWAGRRMLG
jgi:ABC-type Mn2+/Zn2+ transport system permease subunit